MSLITKILEPNRFTPENIAELMLNAIGFSPHAPDLGTIRSNIEATARYVLEQLGARGILSQTEILLPKKFNSATIAILMWEHAAGPDACIDIIDIAVAITQDARQITVDQAQYVLDALYQKGIIG